ncbi:hypothetical protein F5B20DRAFT_592294 [Whalleya microplaca]|nr:hypothetical protein F5B20DRAFT_592294 [Whalleya microplaca]
MDPDTAGFFQEPDDYYPPSPPPTSQIYTLQSGKTITLHLVGHSPLEAHYLWNGARVISKYCETHVSEVEDRTVLELGAGAGLPSIVCAILGARKVVVTDFPDADLVINMKKNILDCELLPRPDGSSEPSSIVADGFVWGADPAHLLAHLAAVGRDRFDVLILADLLFRHSEHGKLVSTIEETLSRKRESKAFVFFTSYRPWLQQKDLAFFDLAREKGFLVEKILEEKMDKAMFENDPGDEEVAVPDIFSERIPDAKSDMLIYQATVAYKLLSSAYKLLSRCLQILRRRGSGQRTIPVLPIRQTGSIRLTELRIHPLAPTCITEVDEQAREGIEHMARSPPRAIGGGSTEIYVEVAYYFFQLGLREMKMLAQHEGFSADASYLNIIFLTFFFSAIFSLAPWVALWWTYRRAVHA